MLSVLAANVAVGLGIADNRLGPSVHPDVAPGACDDVAEVAGQRRHVAGLPARSGSAFSFHRTREKRENRCPSAWSPPSRPLGHAECRSHATAGRLPLSSSTILTADPTERWSTSHAWATLTCGSAQKIFSRYCLPLMKSCLLNVASYQNKKRSANCMIRGLRAAVSSPRRVFTCSPVAGTKRAPVSKPLNCVWLKAL